MQAWTSTSRQHCILLCVVPTESTMYLSTRNMQDARMDQEQGTSTLQHSSETEEGLVHLTLLRMVPVNPGVDADRIRQVCVRHPTFNKQS
jgi:hypothetical protein